jgi:hypothetical protein
MVAGGGASTGRLVQVEGGPSWHEGDEQFEKHKAREPTFWSMPRPFHGNTTYTVDYVPKQGQPAEPVAAVGKKCFAGDRVVPCAS